MSSKYAKDLPVGFANKIEKVAIIGASGHLGQDFINALTATGKHTITALTRPSSTTVFPSNITVLPVDYTNGRALIAALQDQDFLIITLPGPAPPSVHSQIVQAAAKAGIKHIMPNAYGHDILNGKLASEDLYGAGCLARCSEITALGLNYMVMTCGFWYEWSIACSGFGIDIPGRKATFFDDGMTRTNMSTWEQCGKALAAFLSLPILPSDEDDLQPTVSNWVNKPLYISSFKASQRDMLDSIHRVTGTSDDDWEIVYEESGERYKKGLEDLKNGNRMGFVKTIYTRIFYPNGDGDFEAKRGLANEALWLEKEGLDGATKRTVDMLNGGWKPFG